MVYVLANNGRPLMPTSNHAKVRILLKTLKAKIVKRCPFTIQLIYDSTYHIQPLTLGVDAGSKTIGLSVSSETKEYYASEVTLRNDIVNLLATRRELRRSRRHRKTRYRQARFNNRVANKKAGWLAPSIRQKIESHVKVIVDAHKFLPISKIIIETASFDTQRLKADEAMLQRPEGIDYQNGDMAGFWNVREYVLFRDHHQCQHCYGKSKDTVLNIHHLESRKTGGNAPNNLITLCKTCHKKYHAGKITLNIKREHSYRDAAFMGIMRWNCYNRLCEIYSNVQMTYGYLTKNTRISHNLPKEHVIDALCIAGHPEATRCKDIYFLKKIRCHNRQLHKTNFKKGVRKANQAPYLVKGFRLYDKVDYNNQECFIFGRRATGCFDIRKLDGVRVHASVNYKNLRYLECRKNYIIERRTKGNSSY